MRSSRTLFVDGAPAHELEDSYTRRTRCNAENGPLQLRPGGVSDVSAGDRLVANWHLEAITYALTRVQTGEIKRLIINVPPRSLKSICASVAFPAFVLGQDPTRRVICVSYSEALTRKHANDCRALMRSGP